MADTPVAPTPVTLAPTAPQRTDEPATFVTLADAFVSYIADMDTEYNALATNVNFNAESAYDSATEAAASAAASAASAAAAAVASGASAWVSGQAYVTGNVVFSPINFQSYRATTNTSGTTDPSLSADWVFISGNVNTTATQTLTNKTLNGVVLNDGYTEEVFAVTGTTPALSPTNGSIQTWTLSANSTPTAGTWAAGQSITLMIDDGTAYAITWSSLAVTWKTNNGAAPTLNTSGYTVIQLWKVGTTIFGARVGDA